MLSVDISLISHAVPELLLLPVYRPTLLFPVVGRQPEIARINSSKSAIVENIGVAFEISLLSHSVPEL